MRARGISVMRDGGRTAGGRPSLGVELVLSGTLLLLMATALAPGRAQASASCQGPNYRLTVSRSLSWIPQNPPTSHRDCSTEGERSAWLIEHQGNALFRRIRDTQADLIWFVGFVEPLNSPQEAFVWPVTQKLTVRLIDGREVDAHEILTTRGYYMGHWPVIPVYPQGLHATFEDIQLTLPSRKAVLLYFGFPRPEADREWDEDELVSVELVREDLSAQGRR